ncbi:MAG: DNA-processing protein DprA [Oscillospiraceae bacterium]|jgi:DNA processing protein|nr:DNA-processing protein DprA [Oscillospiraceae bacterium]
MRYSREQYFKIWLASVDGIGARGFARLIARYGSAEAVWEHFGEDMRWVGESAWKKMSQSHNRDRATELIARLDRCGACVVFQDDGEYPPLLREIADPPPLLYVRGRRDISDEWCVGVVGTRQPTAYGLRMTRQIAGDLARSGACVTSGFARGIDTAAHTAAVDAGGRTIAVMGCGVDVVYPPENVELLERVLASNGSVVSEFPPGTEPRGMHFPMRNRLISGMSRGVLMVEGKQGSGALHTVSSAVDQNREVFILPGHADSPNSAPGHKLAREGARIITSAVEILEDLHAERIPQSGNEALAGAIKAGKAEQKKRTKRGVKPAQVSMSGDPHDSQALAPAPSAAAPSAVAAPDATAPDLAPLAAAPPAATPPAPSPSPRGGLSADETRVRDAVSSGIPASNVDKIVEFTGLSASAVNTLLTMLAVKGII